jgi:NifU-like protein involved in Fe-S cluster formation
MSDPLYKRSLLRLAADAHGAGHIAEAEHHGEAHNPACGDRVRVDVMLADGRISALAHETRACVLAQASAAVLGRDAIGASTAELLALRGQLLNMLAGNSPPPERPFAAYGEFAGAADIPGRHRCVLLPLDALIAALSGATKA